MIKFLLYTSRYLNKKKIYKQEPGVLVSHIKTFKKIIFLFFFTILFCVSCTTLNLNRQKILAKKATSKTQQEFLKLQKAKGSNRDQIIKTLNIFISKNKNNELAMSAYLLKAKLLLKQKKIKQACKTYHQAVKLPFFYRNGSKAYFASASCYAKQGHTKKALSTLEILVQSPKESFSTRGKVASAQWKLVYNKKSLTDWKSRILSHLIKFYPESPKKTKWKKQGLSLIQPLDQNNLQKMAKQIENYEFFEGFIFYKLGLSFWKQKNLKKSRHYFIQSLASSLDSKTKEEVKYYLGIINSMSKTNPYLIGVILPLSGSKKAVGEKILRGLSMGFNLDKDSPWQMIVMDSKSQPDVTKDSLEKLLHKHYVIGVIGGVTSQTAEVIAEASSSLGIPSILFSQKSDLTKGREFVFQNALTAQDITNKLSKSIKSRKLNIKKVSILAPRDSYGRGYAEIFSKSFRKEGGKILSMQTYKPKEINFETPIKKLVNLHNLKKRQQEYEQLKKEYIKKHPNLSKRSKKLDAKKLLKPEIEFDALFIPDSFNALKKIDAHLKYHGIKNVYLLGTNLWSKKYIHKWSKDRPVVFVSTSDINNKIIRSSIFYRTYKEIFLTSPGIIERQAFNTALVFKTALQNRVRNRLQLLEEMKKIKVLKGAFYEFQISEDRRFKYPLEVFVSHKNRVLTLDSMPD